MWNWLKKNIFVKEMFIYLLVAAIIFYIPAWGAVVTGYIFDESGFYIFAGSYVAIWAGPFTPTIPAILGIAVGLKQIIAKLTNKGRDDDETI
jgi:CHASE2 domain-containing sensor protein